MLKSLVGKRLFQLFLIGPGLLAFSSSGAQNVIRILDGYVLFNTAEGIGKVGETVEVRRRTDKGTVTTGKVRLLLIRDGKASGKIVEEARPLNVQIGDVARGTVAGDSAKISGVLPQSPAETLRPIVRVVPGYALVDPGLERWEKDAILGVKRQADLRLMDVGEMQMVKYENGKAAVKIIREIKPYHIMPGDYAVFKEPKPDIDTYFYR